MDSKENEGRADQVTGAADCSGPKYEIRTVQDFLNVPPDRIDACLSEFKEFLSVTREFLFIAKTLGQVIGEDAKAEVNEFDWIDDGQKKRTIIISPNKPLETEAAQGRR